MISIPSCPVHVISMNYFQQTVNCLDWVSLFRRICGEFPELFNCVYPVDYGMTLDDLTHMIPKRSHHQFFIFRRSNPVNLLPGKVAWSEQSEPLIHVFELKVEVVLG